MTGLTTFFLGCFSCLFVALLFVQDRHNAAVLAALARRDAQTREILRVLCDVVRGQRWELATAEMATIAGQDGAVYALIRLGG